MGFKDAISICLAKYFTISGRATRSEFWWFFLFYNLVTAAGFVLVMVTVSENGEGGVIWPMFVAVIFLVPPLICVTARRLHDKGLTAWLLLLLVVPFGSIAVLILCALRGDAGDNSFGPSPFGPEPEPAYAKSNIPTVKDRD